MRNLTSSQRISLDRIGSSPAAGDTKVVGWACDGPVLRVKGRVLVVLPSGLTEDVQEAPALEA